VRLLITLFGYLVIVISVLGMLAVPLGHLLVGGAITGIIVGIAAQQALGNIFAGLVLLLARPYVVGEQIRVRSGSLGGPFDGLVVGMDLLYTTIETEEGPVRLPNAGLLAAAVGPRPSKEEELERTEQEPPVTAAGDVTVPQAASPNGEHDAHRQPARDDDRPKYPLRNSARHSGAKLRPDNGTSGEDPGSTPGW
jgi:hypothetical protein